MFCLWQKFAQSCKHSKTVLHSPTSAGDGWPELAGSAEVSLTGAAPLTNFPATPLRIFRLSVVTHCFCSQTSILIVLHRTHVLCPKCLGLPVLCPLPPVLSREPCHQLPPASRLLLCCPGKLPHPNISLEHQGTPRRSLVWSPYFYHPLMSYLTCSSPPVI